MKTKAKKLLLNTAFLSSMVLASGGLLMSPASAMANGRHHGGHAHHRGHVRVVIWNPPRPCWRCHYWRPHYRPVVSRRVVFNF